MREGERFSDVCGAIDELRRSLDEEPIESAREPERLTSLVGEALRMQARMEARLDEYLAFRDGVTSTVRSLDAIPTSRSDDAVAASPQLLRLLLLGRPLTPDEREQAVGLAERIRRSAADLEQSLHQYKAAALSLARAYREIRGARTWVLDEAEARALAGTPDQEPWARWLPPSPHRERIVRYLRAGRAHLVGAESALEPPQVQFEDGGLIPLADVRWSEEVRNFHPADAPPHPHGLRYRE